MVNNFLSSSASHHQETNRVASVNITLRSAVECTLQHVQRHLLGHLSLGLVRKDLVEGWAGALLVLGNVVLMLAAKNAVEEGLDEGGTGACGAELEGLGGADGVVGVAHAGALLVEAADDVEGVVGEGASSVENGGEELRERLGGGRAAAVVVLEPLDAELEHLLQLEAIGLHAAGREHGLGGELEQLRVVVAGVEVVIVVEAGVAADDDEVLASDGGGGATVVGVGGPVALHLAWGSKGGEFYDVAFVCDFAVVVHVVFRHVAGLVSRGRDPISFAKVGHYFFVVRRGRRMFFNRFGRREKKNTLHILNESNEFSQDREGCEKLIEVVKRRDCELYQQRF